MKKSLFRKIMPLLLALVFLGLVGCNVNLPFTGNRSNDDGPAPFAGVTFSDYIELGDIRGIELPSEEEMLLNVIRAQFEQVGFPIFDIEPNDNTIVEEGDHILLDFSGYAPGHGRFEGGTAEGHVMQDVGAGSFIPGFEEQIIGQTVGVEFDVTVTFPDDYWEEDLAGAEVVFTCTVQAIGDLIPGTPSDEEVAMLMQGQMETLEELLAFMQEQGAAEDALNSTALEVAMENATFLGLPESEMERLMEINLEQIETSAQMQGMTAEELILNHFDSMESFWETELEPWAQELLFVFAVAEQEGFEITEEELNDWIQQIREEEPQFADATDAEILEEVGGRYLLTGHLMTEKVGEFIAEHAQFAS